MSAQGGWVRLCMMPAILGIACLLPAARTVSGAEAFEALLNTGQWAKAEADARTRLETNADDPKASADVARAIVESGRLADFGEAVRMLEVAVAAEPEEARHWFYLGRAHGRVAQTRGLTGLSDAGKSRRALERAIVLDPRSFRYVYALNEFFLQAPFIAGGSVRKARRQAEAFAAIDTGAATLLLARIDIETGDLDAALMKLRGVPPRGESLFEGTRRNLLAMAGE